MADPAAKSEIQIRYCNTLEEYEQCVEVEHATWGPRLSVPSAIFVVANHTGGQTIGAFDGARIIGFTLGLVGVRDGVTFIHSHMTAVLRDYQNRGVGRALKLFQRENALNRGIKLVEWTFDPLEIKNAHFNLNRLGAVARRLMPNFYGVTNSDIHGTIPTDRLVAEWWIDSERVRSAIEDKPATGRGQAAEHVTLPSNIGELRAADPETAERVQTAARGQFQRAFARGLAVIGMEPREPRADYILQPANQIEGLNLSS